MLYGRCIALCGIVLLLSCTVAYATCAVNAHIFAPDADNTYETEFLYGDEEGDRWGRREHLTCVNCDLTIEEETITKTIAHNFQYSKDEGHGNGEHFYEYSCLVCGRAELRTVVCNGPPCQLIATKDPEEAEIEQVDPEEQEVDE